MQNSTDETGSEMSWKRFLLVVNCLTNILIISKNNLEAKWTFNVSTLTRKVEGVSAGHLIEIGARPNTGKTSFHASLVAGQGGFAHQGARCVVLCNEESAHRVGARYLTSATGMTMHEIKANPDKARDKYEIVKKNIFIKDAPRTNDSAITS